MAELNFKLNINLNENRIISGSKEVKLEVDKIKNSPDVIELPEEKTWMYGSFRVEHKTHGLLMHINDITITLKSTDEVIIKFEIVSHKVICGAGCSLVSIFYDALVEEEKHVITSTNADFLCDCKKKIPISHKISFPGIFKKAKMAKNNLKLMIRLC